MRLVLDTNVAVSAILGESAPGRLIELAQVLERPHVARTLERKGGSTADTFALHAPFPKTS